MSLVGFNYIRSGFWMPGKAGENIGNRDVVYLSGDETWHLADADVAATMPAMGISQGTYLTGESVNILTAGVIHSPSWTWTPGAKLYVSTVAGGLTETAPVFPDWAQVVAYAFRSNIIYFDPDVSAASSPIGEEDIFYAYTDPNTNVGTHAGGRLTDDVDVLMRMDFYLPSDFDIATWSVDVIVVAGGTANLRWGITTNWGAVCSESYVASNDAIAATQTAVTVNVLTCLDITSGLTGSAARDLVGLEFTRYASDVLDTVNADCYFLGVLVRRP